MNIDLILKLVSFLTGMGGIFEQQQIDKETREKDEARYEQSLAELGGAAQPGGLYGRIMPQIRNIVTRGQISGEREKQTVDRAFNRRKGLTKDALVSGGMYNSLTGPAAMSNLEGERQYAQAGVSDMIKRYNVGLEQMPLQQDIGLTGQRLATIGSREDIPGQAYLGMMSNLFRSFIPPPKVDQPQDNSLAAAGITAGADLFSIPLTKWFS